MIAKWLDQLGILDMTGLNPALYENVFWTDFAKISHSELGRVGDPQKVTRGDKGRDPIFSRGDVTPKLLFYYKSYDHNSNFTSLFKGQP